MRRWYHGAEVMVVVGLGEIWAVLKRCWGEIRWMVVVRECRGEVQ